MFSWQWYVIRTFFFSLNYTKLLLSCNKPAFRTPAGAQLDLLSWMEANRCQTHLFPVSQWVPVPQSCQLTQRCHADWAPLPKHWQEPGATAHAGAAGWGNLSLLRQGLWLLHSSGKMWICPSWHIHLPGMSDVASRGCHCSGLSPLPSRAGTPKHSLLTYAVSIKCRGAVGFQPE